jgi:ribosomal protein S1
VAATDRRLIRGVVTRHAPFGFFVDIGEEQDALVERVSMTDDLGADPGPLPDIGSEVVAALLGYTEHAGVPQTRLSIRPSHLRTAGA